MKASSTPNYRLTCNYCFKLPVDPSSPVGSLGTGQRLRMGFRVTGYRVTSLRIRASGENIRWTAGRLKASGGQESFRLSSGERVTFSSHFHHQKERPRITGMFYLNRNLHHTWEKSRPTVRFFNLISSEIYSGILMRESFLKPLSPNPL